MTLSCTSHSRVLPRVYYSSCPGPILLPLYYYCSVAFPKSESSVFPLLLFRTAFTLLHPVYDLRMPVKTNQARSTTAMSQGWTVRCEWTVAWRSCVIFRKSLSLLSMRTKFTLTLTFHTTTLRCTHKLGMEQRVEAPLLSWL